VEFLFISLIFKSQQVYYAKVILDEVFGYDNFVNEIIREKSNPKNYTKSGFGNIHDVIFFYSKSDNINWNRPLAQRAEEKIIIDFPFVDKDNRRYSTAPLHAPGAVVYSEVECLS